MKQLSHTEISSFCAQTAMALHAGIPVAESVSMMADEAQDAQLREVLTQMLKELLNGTPFTEVLKKAGIFPEYMLQMVHLGEDSGRLDDVMTHLAVYYEREGALSDGIKNAVSYPAVMIGMMVIIIFVLIIYVLPVFNTVYEQLGTVTTGFTRGMMVFSEALNTYAPFFAVLLAAAAVYMIWSTRSAAGIAHMNARFYHSVFTKKLAHKMELSRLTGALAMTLASGIDRSQALALASEVIENPELREKVTASLADLERGKSLTEALIENKVYTGLNARMLKIGSMSGMLDNTFSQIAARYDTEIDEDITGSLAAIEPTLVAVLSVIVGLILLAVMLPLLSIMSNIG